MNKVYIVQERSLPIAGEIDPSPSEWENKKVFLRQERAFKYIQTLDPKVKKAFPDIPHDYHYVGRLFEWKIDEIELESKSKGE